MNSSTNSRNQRLNKYCQQVAINRQQLKRWPEYKLLAKTNDHWTDHAICDGSMRVSAPQSMRYDRKYQTLQTFRKQISRLRARYSSGRRHHIFATEQNCQLIEGRIDCDAIHAGQWTSTGNNTNQLNIDIHQTDLHIQEGRVYSGDSNVVRGRGTFKF